jgi:oligopeptide transport system substrate-binding protein
VAATSVIATVAACGSSSSSGGVNLASLPVTPVDARVGKPGGTFRLAIVEPTAIDPYNSQESEGLLVTKGIFDTLTTVSPDGKIQKQLAQSYNRDATCTTWTFDLKPNQKFSNGEAVDAESIKRGMTRAALGTAASDVAYHMSNIKGYDALQSSKATDPTKVTFPGVTATGDVLKVSLTKPDCEFDLKTAQPVYSPVPVEAGAASNTKYNDMPIGNGPFKMAGPWQHNKSITLVANDAYTDGPKAMLSKVELTIQDGSDSSFEYKGFKNGDFDYARVSAASDLQPAAKEFYTPDPTTNAFVKANTYGIEYLLVNVKNPPLNSVKAREAVSYAIDRDAIISGVLKDSVTKATSLVPPAFTSQGTYQPGICASCVKQDKNMAKELAKEAGLPAGTKVNVAYNTGAGHDPVYQAIAGELTDVLGWNVNLQPEAFKDLLKNENLPNASGIFRSGWTADYPTAWDFLYPLLGTQPPDNPGNNSGRYSNPMVDSLLAQGQAEPDPTKRADLYKQAEKIAIGQDLGAIPLYVKTQYSVFSSKFVGGNIDFFVNPTLRTIGLKP